VEKSRSARTKAAGKRPGTDESIHHSSSLPEPVVERFRRSTGAILQQSHGSKKARLRGEKWSKNGLERGNKRGEGSGNNGLTSIDELATDQHGKDTEKTAINPSPSPHLLILIFPNGLSHQTIGPSLKRAS
jgi:hypothetical protein